MFLPLLWLDVSVVLEPGNGAKWLWIGSSSSRWHTTASPIIWEHTTTDRDVSHTVPFFLMFPNLRLCPLMENTQLSFIERSRKVPMRGSKYCLLNAVKISISGSHETPYWPNCYPRRLDIPRKVELWNGTGILHKEMRIERLSQSPGPTNLFP